jgi:hypothetical protein
MDSSNEFSTNSLLRMNLEEVQACGLAKMDTNAQISTNPPRLRMLHSNLKADFRVQVSLLDKRPELRQWVHRINNKSMKENESKNNYFSSIGLEF